MLLKHPYSRHKAAVLWLQSSGALNAMYRGLKKEKVTG